MDKYLGSYYAGMGLIIVLTNGFKSCIIKTLIFTFVYWINVFIAEKIK